MDKRMADLTVEVSKYRKQLGCDVQQGGLNFALLQYKCTIESITAVENIGAEHY